MCFFLKCTLSVTGYYYAHIPNLSSLWYLDSTQSVCEEIFGLNKFYIVDLESVLQ